MMQYLTNQSSSFSKVTWAIILMFNNPLSYFNHHYHGSTCNILTHCIILVHYFEMRFYSFSYWPSQYLFWKHFAILEVLASLVYHRLSIIACLSSLVYIRSTDQSLNNLMVSWHSLSLPTMDHDANNFCLRSCFMETSKLVYIKHSHDKQIF